MLEGRVTVNGATVRELGTEGRPGARRHPRRRPPRQDRRAPSLPPAEQAARLRDDAIGSASGGRRCIDLLRGVTRVRLSGRPARLRIGRPAAADQRRRPRRAAHASRATASRASTRRACSASPTRAISSASRAASIDRRPPRPRGPSVKLLAARTRRETARRWSITVREGRNRQVRKMCDAIGHPVDASEAGRDRADHAMRRLKAGQWRELTADEVEAARSEAASREPEASARTPLGSSPEALRLVERQHAPRAASARRGAAPRGRAPRPCPRPSADRVRSFRPKRIRNSFVVAYRNGRPTTCLRPTILIRCRSSSVFSTPDVLTPRISVISTAVIGCW